MLAIIILLMLASRAIERKRKREGSFKYVKEAVLPDMAANEKRVSLFSALFKEQWPRLVTVLFITLFTVVALIYTGEELAVTKSFLYPAVALTEQLGVQLPQTPFEQALNIVDEGLLTHHNIVQNIGIVLGASIFGLLSGSFSFAWQANLKETGVFILSGFLMGMGAILASGCIVGALYSGIVNFSLSGWVVFFSMSFGMWLTVRLMNGKISTIPEVTKE